MIANVILWSGVTILVFYVARRVFLRTKIQLLHPVLVTTVVLFAMVEFSGGRFADYAEGTEWMGWVLGPGVVAMGVPVYKLRAIILSKFSVLVAVVVTTFGFGLVSTIGMLALFGLERVMMVSLSLKNVTAAVAVALARDAGALPAVAGVAAMFGAVLGAAFSPWVLEKVGVRDPRAVGLAMGCGSHAIGTARAFELGETEGTFSSVGLSLTTLVAALVCPPVFLWFLSRA